MIKLSNTLLCLALVLLAGCASGPSGTIGGKTVDIDGVVTQIFPGDESSLRKGNIGWVTVEGKQGSGNYDKAYITVTTTSQLYSRVGNEESALTFNEIKVNDRVQVNFIGDVQQMQPVKARAAQVVVVRPGTSKSWLPF
ncbi:MAG: hypothetical protein SGI71_13605 [Verrucomicrobiota bacterium]|nr:hypothetical protein [Verrucomicrobiota bacterium]